MTTLTEQRPISRVSPSWTRVDALILIVLFVIGLLLALPVSLLRLDLQDDGLYMHQANIILNGGVPYRDYLSHDPPLGNAWHALLLALFGNDVLVLRLAALPFEALLLPVVYALSRPLVPGGPALLAALVVTVTDTASNYTVAHLAQNALALALTAVVILMVWSNRPRYVWLVLAGLVIGVMAGFKQNMGLYLLAGSALWLIDPKWTMDDGRRTMEDGTDYRVRVLLAATWILATASVLWLVRANPEPTVLISLVLPVVALAVAAFRSQSELKLSLGAVVARWGALALGFLIATVPWVGWATIGAGVTTLVEGLLVAPSRLPEIWFAPLRAPAPEFWWLMVLYFGGVAVAAGALVLVRNQRNPRRAALVAWACLALWFLALALILPFQENATTGLIYTWLYFNILVFWPSFVLIERLPAGHARTHARLLLLTATFLALEMYPQLRRIQANWCFPLFVPLAAWLLWRLSGAVSQLAGPAHRKVTRLVPAVAVGLLPVLALWWVLDWRITQHLDLAATQRTGQLAPVIWKRLDLPHFSLWDTPANYELYRRMASAITSRTSPGEPIYAFYRPVAIYLATGRPPAVRNVYAPPETTVEDAERMREELRSADVRVVLVDMEALLPGGPLDEFSPGRVVDWPLPIRNYIISDFSKVEELGEWSVWQRKE